MFKKIAGLIVFLCLFAVTSFTVVASTYTSDDSSGVAENFVNRLVDLGVSESDLNETHVRELLDYVFSQEGATVSVVHFGTSTVEVVPNSELPSDVVPLDVNNPEHAKLIVDVPQNKFVILTDVPISDDVITRSSSGHLDIQTVAIDPTFLGLRMHLKTYYTLQGTGANAIFQSVSPYTTCSGWSLGQDWEERTVGADIYQPSKKTAYVYGSGDYVQFLLINTSFTEIVRTPISMAGTIYITTSGAVNKY